MTSPAVPLDPATLLADSTWLRSLSRGLVRDHFSADDVAQEAWLLALRREHRAEGLIEHRTWLTGVVRNLAWKRERTETRRLARERRGAREESCPSTGELVARAEMQRALSDAVVALEEPFRTTILLRYLEDLSSADIARKLGVPEGTVRWRVKRGLERLRAQLETKHGGDWLHSCALVAGLMRAPEAAAAAAAAGATGVLGLKAAGLIATGLALTAGGVALTNLDPGTASGTETSAIHTTTFPSFPDGGETASEVEFAGDAGASQVRIPLAVQPAWVSGTPQASEPLGEVEHGAFPEPGGGSRHRSITAQFELSMRAAGPTEPKAGEDVLAGRIIALVSRDPDCARVPGGFGDGPLDDSIDRLADERGLSDDERADLHASVEAALARSCSTVPDPAGGELRLGAVELEAIDGALVTVRSLEGLSCAPPDGSWALGGARPRFPGTVARPMSAEPGSGGPRISLRAADSRGGPALERRVETRRIDVTPR